MNSFSENQPPNEAASPHVQQLLATGISAVFIIKQTLNELMQKNYIPLNRVLADLLRSSVNNINQMYIKLLYEAECYRNIPQWLQMALETQQDWAILKNFMEGLLMRYLNILGCCGEGIFYFNFQ